MDPGQTYYTYAIGIMNTMHRGLYAYLPGSTEQPVPDLADGDPQIAEDGKTVTVKLKRGRHVLQARQPRGDVRRRQVRDRARLHGQRARPVRARLLRRPRRRPDDEPGKYKEVPGIETPDDQTIVFKLNKGTGAALAGALAMPISIPVPKEYAQKYDRRTRRPTTSTGLHRPVQARDERRRATRSPATCPARRSTSSATRTTRRSTTSGPRSSTRSTSRPATTTPRSPRGAS